MTTSDGVPTTIPATRSRAGDYRNGGPPNNNKIVAPGKSSTRSVGARVLDAREHAERLQAARSVLDQLPELMHEVRVRRSLTYREISEETGLSLPGVYSIMRRQTNTSIVVCLKILDWLKRDTAEQVRTWINEPR